MIELKLVCMNCSQAGRRPIPIIPQPLNDLGVYEFTCPHGHHQVVLLQEHKFEVLFELGARALLEGNPRDCVTAIGVSLERFYEFYLHVIAIKNGVSPEEFEQSWKQISSQSERQLGAFAIAYCMSNQRPATLLDDKWVNFRNKVVHKGYLPTQNEARLFAECNYNLMEGYLNDLKDHEKDSLNKMIGAHVNKLRMLAIERGVAVDNKPLASLTTPGVLSVSSGMRFTFQEALQHLRDRMSRGF